MESASSPGHVRLTSTTASRLPREVQSLLYFEEIDIKGEQLPRDCRQKASLGTR